MSVKNLVQEFVCSHHHNFEKFFFRTLKKDFKTYGRFKGHTPLYDCQNLRLYLFIKLQMILCQINRKIDISNIDAMGYFIIRDSILQYNPL